MSPSELPRQSDGYDTAFEAGALAALEYVTDERPDLEDVTMRAAEKVGQLIEKMQKAGLR